MENVDLCAGRKTEKEAWRARARRYVATSLLIYLNLLLLSSVDTYSSLGNHAMKIKTSTMSNTDTYWSFGYGSNMDVEFVESKKGLKVLG